MYFRFSPIKNKDQLLEAITYTHSKCFALCKQAFGKYLPVSGNIGIFCHYDDEYEFLTKLREELTERDNNWNQKYFLLHEPLIIPAQDDLPETKYTYLYIRKPDQHTEVGDVDFVIGKDEHQKLKNLSITKNKINDIEVLYRPDLDMIRLSRPDIDALSYINTKTMEENVK